ncbi:precorrin-6A synthase (deacetylating) [Nocardioides dubius]|uniref:Precorrin-6A synthase (Deacetylating) n=1 Tax=Nocardioides dubius TaxID=317019 RepID=A0ABN1TP16_9ACTN
MTLLHVVGFGMGPHHLTWEAAQALTEADYVLAVRKGPSDPLLEVRRAICDSFGVELVEVSDPERDRDDPADYPAAVRDWHRARVAAFAEEIAEREGTGAFLVWGDPSLYDSTLRVLEQIAELVEVTWTVVPGISAPQILAARHGVVLHDVGGPVHVTTSRRLRAEIDAGQGNLVVMLTSDRTLADLADPALADWRIWWGANLGAAGEQLVAGRLGDVVAELRAAREAARESAGWVMDLFLLRAPEQAR